MYTWVVGRPLLGFHTESARREQVVGEEKEVKEAQGEGAQLFWVGVQGSLVGAIAIFEFL